jgi:phosphomannomutase
MSIAQFFKAYDLRGTTPNLTAEVYYWSGFGLIETILKPQNLPLSVIITRDCRLSSLEFYNAFAKGIEDAGGSIILLGIGTTDLMYAASMSLDLPGAIITASHNPPLDNGLKIVKKIPQMLGLKDGLDKIRDFVVNKIEIEKIKINLKNTTNYQENSQIKNQVIQFFVDKIKEIGKVEELIKLVNLESQNSKVGLEFLDKVLQNEQNKQNNSINLQIKLEDNPDKNQEKTSQFQFKKLKVVVDTANGMGGFIMPYLQEIYKNLVDFVPLFWELDGSFPNHAADPMNPHNLRFLSQKVLEEQADFGIAMDGDADRAFFVDENGILISGEHLVALFAQEILNDNFENGEPKIKQIELKSCENIFNSSKENIVENNNLNYKKNSSQNISNVSDENLILEQKKSQESVQKTINSKKVETDLQDKFNMQFNPAIVYVISYSRALPDTVLENNGIPIISKQGHTFVKSQMSKYKAIYGGEASGHHYFGQFGFMDSGAITIAIFIKILIQKNLQKQNFIQNSDNSQNVNQTQKPLKASQLCKKWSEKYFVSGEQNFILPKNLTMPKVVQIIKKNYSKLAISELDGITVYDILSKFTIRGSNTEPLLRINIETKIENKTQEILDKIKKILNLNS